MTNFSDIKMTLPFLYLSLTTILLIAAFTNYLFGLYDSLIIMLLVSIATLFSALYLLVVNELDISFGVNCLLNLVIITFMSLQLLIDIDSGAIWIFALPLLAFTTLPVRIAISSCLVVLIISAIQVLTEFNTVQSLQFVPLFILFSITILYFTYFNRRKKIALKNHAITDNESGAFTNKHLVKILEKEIARSKVTKRTLSLISISIKDYDQITEFLGRRTTKEFLREFKSALTDELRVGDECFYDGHGNFYTTLPNCPMDGALILKERLLTDLNNKLWENIGELDLSIEIVTLNEKEDANSFLDRSIKSLSKQKQTVLRFKAF